MAAPRTRAALLVALVLWSVSPAAAETVADGAPITPEFAQALFDRVAPMREADGCRLTSFDTSRFRIAIGLRSQSGTDHTFELATAPGLISVDRQVGEWALAVPAALERDCPSTVAAIQNVLVGTAAPQGAWSYSAPVLVSSYTLLVVAFALLLLGTAHVLVREIRLQRPPRGALLALFAIWAIGLALRLWLSPHTFLHEYFHIAETVPAYLTGEVAPGYGKTGPALFRLVGRMLGRAEDVHVIFLTNAVISSLAVPAAALLSLAVMRSWAQALLAAVLLCILPQHLRFSAGEDLFVQAVTFGMWALALLALYVRTRRFADALLAAVALALATQTRPEMIFLPGLAVAMVLCTAPRQWRVLFDWRTLAALALFAVLMVPHLLELQRAMLEARSPSPNRPTIGRYLEVQVLGQSAVTPPVVWLLLVVGAAWALRRRPGWLLWIALVYVGYTLFSLSLYDNPPFHLRSQLLPTAYAMLLAACSASVWTALWGDRQRLAAGVGAGLLVALAAGVVLGWQPFVTQLKDQQLEWAFLERSVPQLPERATLLSAIDQGGRNLDAFPEFLLRQHDRDYKLIDVRQAARGETAWPAAGALYYQGMFCYFAFHDEPTPDPMTPTCLAVHERYELEPLMVEDLDTEGFSALRYAQGGKGIYRIGFFRLRPKT